MENKFVSKFGHLFSTICCSQKLFRLPAVIFFFFSSSAVAQKPFSLQIGGGLGHSLSKDKKSRFKVQASGYYNINQQLSAGLEVSTVESFIYPITDEVSINPITNAIHLDASNIYSSALLAKIRYCFRNKENGFKPFVEFGMGSNVYLRKIFDVPALTSQRIKRTNFAFQPEAGSSVGHFSASLGYLIVGKTPSFTGVNDRVENVSFEQIALNTLYFNASWRFDFGKRKE